MRYLAAATLILAIQGSAVAQVTPRDGMIERAISFVGAQGVSIRANTPRVRAVSQQFRISARETHGQNVVGEWWLSADNVQQMNAEPAVGVANFSFNNPGGRVDLWMRLETNWQLYFECEASMDDTLKWEAVTTTTPPGFATGQASRDPSNGRLIFVTPAPDGTLPDFLSHITLTNHSTLGGTAMWTLVHCDVLPITLN